MIVTSEDANGEIGFSDDFDLIVAEPDSGNNTVCLIISFYYNLFEII